MSRVMPLTWSTRCWPSFQKINAQYQGADRVKALLGLSGIFADDLPQNADFVGAVTAAYQQLCERGARECVAAL